MTQDISLLLIYLDKNPRITLFLFQLDIFYNNGSVVVYIRCHVLYIINVDYYSFISMKRELDKYVSHTKYYCIL